MSAAREDALAPAKIDKPRIAEILPFTASSDLFSAGYAEESASKQEAMRREYAIKHLSRKEKEALIASDKNILH